MELRAQIANLIDEIVPVDDKELMHKNVVLHWIESGADLFRIKKPAFPDMHLVSYFVPFDGVNKEILLVHHKKSNLWLPPGGHVDIDEHPKQTASREMQEELYAKAVFPMDDPLLLTVSQTVNDPNPHTDVSLWYLVEGQSSYNYQFDEREFYDIQWFSLQNLPTKQVEPHLHRFVHKLTKAINI